jgi:hypothetical protein
MVGVGEAVGVGERVGVGVKVAVLVGALVGLISTTARGVGVMAGVGDGAIAPQPARRRAAVSQREMM